MFDGQQCEGGENKFAGTAPGRPESDEDGLRRFDL